MRYSARWPRPEYLNSGGVRWSHCPGAIASAPGWRWRWPPAQRTSALLLDEPTTFLDIAHQAETLELLREMNRQEGRTIVMALHNLAQACRYADFIVVMKDGKIVAAGSPEQTIDAELVRNVFELHCVVVPDPVSGNPMVLPPTPVQRDARAGE